MSESGNHGCHQKRKKRNEDANSIGVAVLFVFFFVWLGVIRAARPTLMGQDAGGSPLEIERLWNVV